MSGPMGHIITASLPLDPTPRAHPEADFQKGLVQILRLAMPTAVIYAIPNGGKRSRKGHAIAVGQGLLPGMPDLAIAWNHQTIYLELKSARGYRSEAQRDVHRQLSINGFPVIVAKTPEAVLCALAELGVELRATVSA